MSDNIPIKSPASNQVNTKADLTPEQLAAIQGEVSKANIQKSTSVAGDYPTEVIDLPSEGFFYPSDSPLASGKLELKYMTAKEEDILTSQNLIKKGVVLDKLLEALVVTPGVSPEDLLVGDRNAIFVAARILAYGSKYEAKVTCPKCGEENRVSIDLATMTNKDFDFSGFKRGINEFNYQLPISQKNITFKLLTGHDEKAIDQEIKAMNKFNKDGASSEVTTRLKYMIVAIDGNTDRQFIKDFVDNKLSSRDAREFRKYIKETSPDFDMMFDFECEHCGHTGRVAMPMAITFFWPDSEL